MPLTVTIQPWLFQPCMQGRAPTHLCKTSFISTFTSNWFLLCKDFIHLITGIHQIWISPIVQQQNEPLNPKSSMHPIPYHIYETQISMVELDSAIQCRSVPHVKMMSTKVQRTFKVKLRNIRLKFFTFLKLMPEPVNIIFCFCILFNFSQEPDEVSENSLIKV